MNAERPLRPAIKRYVVPVAENGRMNLPAELRRALGMKGGETITIEQTEDGIEIVSKAQRLARAREIARPYLQPGRSMSEELVRERRAEVEKEEAELKAWKKRWRG